MERDTVAAQQAAIEEVRVRYERGDLSYEAFRRALDALVLARDEEECRAVLAEIPASGAGALAALDRPAALPVAPPVGVSTGVAHKWIVAFMATTKKTRRRWRLQPRTHTVAIMGEAKLDLRLAELPPHATIEVAAVMGGVTIYVPRSLRVAVHTIAMMADVNVLGENMSGMVAFGQEDHTPEDGPPAADLVIRAFVFMGNVHVVLTDGPVVTVAEVVREALRTVAGGLARGFVSGAADPTIRQIE